MRISLDQNAGAVVGQGMWADKPFSLSALIAPHGPLVLTQEDGTSQSGLISLAPDGGRLTLAGLGAPITLSRGGDSLPVAKGSFTGRFEATKGEAWRVNLHQSGNLLAGTGFIRDKPVAITASLTGTKEAQGWILFADESRNGVQAVLSDDGKTLKVKGLGAILEMKRK